MSVFYCVYVHQRRFFFSGGLSCPPCRLFDYQYDIFMKYLTEIMMRVCHLTKVVRFMLFLMLKWLVTRWPQTMKVVPGCYATYNRKKSTVNRTSPLSFLSFLVFHLHSAGVALACCAVLSACCAVSSAATMARCVVSATLTAAASTACCVREVCR